MAGDKNGSGDAKSAAGSPISLMVKDPERLARNIALIVEALSRAAANYLKPRENGSVSGDLVDEISLIYDADIAEIAAQLVQMRRGLVEHVLHEVFQPAGKGIVFRPGPILGHAILGRGLVGLGARRGPKLGLNEYRHSQHGGKDRNEESAHRVALKSF